jgi:glycerol-3-phosphate dehydrogenase
MGIPTATGTHRARHWSHALEEPFDVAILGGGISGSCLYDTLCRRGYRVLLIDRKDFASGTSQASGMMVWGGLLYLRQLDLATVFRLSRSRDRMVRDLEDRVRVCPYRYIPSRNTGLARLLLAAGLGAYWLLGGGKRRRSMFERSFPEQGVLVEGARAGAFRIEEAFLNASDSRFVLSWITPHGPPRGSALNHCDILSGHLDLPGRHWLLQLKDGLTGAEGQARSRVLVNCAGSWADDINRRFDIRSPLKHVFSKGVYVGLQRSPEHEMPLIFDLGRHGDVMTYVPWGPIALWGPTETSVTHREEGCCPEPEDVRFLLKEAGLHLRHRVTRGDIISVRCGVRSLVVSADYSEDRYPLEISRRSAVVADRAQPWISVYGGKMTGCREVAAKVARLVEGRLGRGRLPTSGPETELSETETSPFPGLCEAVPSAAWCKEQEFCYRVDDYLRRRTNISQWIPRQGLGRQDEHLEGLTAIAREFEDASGESSDSAMLRYRTEVANNFDALLDAV